MAVDSTGDRNAPIFSSGGVPADGPDLTYLGQLITLLGTRRVGTSQQRGALLAKELFDGLLFREPDGQTLEYISGTWVPVGTKLKGHLAVTSQQWSTSSSTPISLDVGVKNGHKYRVDASVLGGQVTSNGTPQLNLTANGTGIGRFLYGTAYTVGQVVNAVSGFAIFTATADATVTFGITGSTSAGAFRAAGGDFFITDLGVVL